MDLEEIETIYKKDLEKAEKEFLEGIKNSKDVNKIEEKYKKALESSRERYYNSIHFFIKEQNKEKKKKVDKKEKIERFKLDKRSLEISSYEKFKNKLSLFFFKIRFNLRNFRRRNIPYFLSIFNIKIKLKISKVSNKINNLILSITEGIKNAFENSRESTKEFTKKLIEKSKDLPEKTLSLFKRKNTKKLEGKNEGEKEDADEK